MKRTNSKTGSNLGQDHRARQVTAWQVRLGQLITVERERQGLTIAELAKRSGLSRPTLSRAESGTHPLSLKFIYKLERELNYPLFEKARASQE